MARKRPNEIINKDKSTNITECFYVKYDDTGKELSRSKTYSVNRKTGCITFFPNNMEIKEIELPGRTSLPTGLFDERGYLKDGLGVFLQYRIGKAKLDISKIIIEVGIENTIKKEKTKMILALNYKELQNLQKRIKIIRHKAKQDLGIEFDIFLHENFPKSFDKPADHSASITRKLNSIFSNLDEDVISHMDRSHVDSFIDFFSVVLEKRYKSDTQKKKLLSLARVKINSIPLKELIREYKKRLNDNVSENEWSKFLRKNLFLIDPSYIHAFNEIHLTLGAKSRKADFGLVDIKNFLDIFEIKRPTTKLLAATEDRGNHYWHSDATKAIVQAEKYLYNAEKSSLALAADLEREAGIQVSVIRPKVILLIGHTDQLDTKKKRDDFRILRNSLKNIEIILYDELYEKLKILEKGKVYSG